MNSAPGTGRLVELAGVFLKLGAVAFGGPAAHIAMMEDEVVRRRGWLTREEFLDLLGATNLIPGPNSTELAIHIGRRRAGWAGLLLAGGCFILPAALIVTAMAWAYVRFGDLPRAEGLLDGVKPVIVAVVAQALWGLGRSAAKTRLLALAGVVATALYWLGVHELVVLFGTGAVVALVRCGPSPWRPGSGGRLCGVVPFVPVVFACKAAPAGAAFGLWPLFLFFVKVGSVLFGSGYLLLAFLRADLVERFQWLTEGQLLDAIAAGQVTPGPVLTTATFVGYVLGGLPGAMIATAGIFLPAFFFVVMSAPIMSRMRRSAWAGSFLDGVNVASLALMAVVTWHLGRAALADALSAGLAVVGAVLLFRYRVNSAWLVLGGAVVGWIVGSLGD